MPTSKKQSATRKCDKKGFPDAQRMLLMCLDRKTAKCANARRMMESWKYLKLRLKQLGLEKKGGVLRQRTGCIGICVGGPIIAVMPDGVWYGGCTPQVIDQIIQQHLIEGIVVEEHVISRSGWAASEISG